MERELKKEALKKFGTTKSKRASAYIFGTMYRAGWRRNSNGSMSRQVKYK